jgi:hypothetical protein
LVSAGHVVLGRDQAEHVALTLGLERDEFRDSGIGGLQGGVLVQVHGGGS